LFSEDIPASTSPLQEALRLAGMIGEQITIQNSSNILTLLSGLGFLPARQNRDIQQWLGTVDKTIYYYITERRHSNHQYDDLLSMLLAARDPITNAPLSDQQVRDELLTIYLAGNETSAMALSWGWYLLAQHPQIEQKLVAEGAAILAGHTPTLDTVSRLTY